MLAEWAEALEWQDLMAWADAMADNNMVITLKRIPDTKGFQCSVTGTKGSTKENLCLVTRASTATKALISAMYKDVMVLQGIWQGVKREEDFDL
ncbi:MAG: hypothetical protein JOZ77_13275 [Candidatus Eremiobacteraeota bacterium]|nr:hypothetical protein [Candidatus Eremiobacteraeota bacterium]